MAEAVDRLGGLDALVGAAGVVDTIQRAETFPAQGVSRRYRGEPDHCVHRRAGIRVNAVVPGLIATPKVPGMPAQVRDRKENHHATKVLSTKDDLVAGVLAELTRLADTAGVDLPEVLARIERFGHGTTIEGCSRCTAAGCRRR